MEILPEENQIEELGEKEEVRVEPIKTFSD